MEVSPPQCDIHHIIRWWEPTSCACAIVCEISLHVHISHWCFLPAVLPGLVVNSLSCMNSRTTSRDTSGICQTASVAFFLVRIIWWSLLYLQALQAPTLDGPLSCALQHNAHIGVSNWHISLWASLTCFPNSWYRAVLEYKSWHTTARLPSLRE